MRRGRPLAEAALELGTAGPLLFAYVLRLQALRPLHDLELHPVAFRERPESLHLDGSVVDEDVLAAFLRDEAEPLAVVEPLHRALRHEKPSLVNGRVPPCRFTAGGLHAGGVD